MYHALPIGLTTLLIYLFTLFLSSSGLTTKTVHRRFWNWILLGSFLIAGLFGLFMALKITYKWDIPFYDQLRQWHVETGIAMAFTGIIHFTWHIGYYFRKSEQRNDNSVVTGRGMSISQGTASKLLMLTGFASSSAQFIMMREASIMGGGSEASTGSFLWVWLVIAAAGASAGSRPGLSHPGKLMWTLITGMFVAPMIFILMNRLLLGPGEISSMSGSLVIIAVSALPVTFISALVFVRLSAIRQQTGGSVAGSSFAIETIGSVTAGIITTLTLAMHLSNYRLYILVLLASTLMTVMFLNYPLWMRRAAMVSVILLALAAVILNPDTAVRDMLLRGVRAEKSIDTPYGNITIGTYGGERTVFYDHRPLFFSGDIIRSEENIHYPLLQRQKFGKVIVISGGISKHIEQLVKHDIDEVVYLEHDPGVIAAEGAADTTAGKMQLKVVRKEPLAFFRKNGDTFDAVLQLIPPPSALSVNRFFTVEYFRLVKEHLSPEGIFMCTPMPYYNYSPESYRKGFSPVFNALKKTFDNVMILPGSSLYAIASDGALSDSISVLAARSGIVNDYVNSDYLNDDETRRRSKQILSLVDHGADLNTALKPSSSLFTNVLSLESRGPGRGIIAMVFAMIVLPFVLVRKGGFVMFASSAGLAGFGMMLIFVLQVTTGNIYMLTALMLTFLMSGLAAGAAGTHTTLTRQLIVCPLLLFILFILTGLLAPFLVTVSPGIIIPLVLVLLASAGFLTGRTYRMLTLHGGQKTTGTVYASDLAGSALGYLTVSALLVPLIGIGNVCFALASLILIAGIFAVVTIKH